MPLWLAAELALSATLKLWARRISASCDKLSPSMRELTSDDWRSINKRSLTFKALSLSPTPAAAAAAASSAEDKPAKNVTFLLVRHEALPSVDDGPGSFTVCIERMRRRSGDLATSCPKK